MDDAGLVNLRGDTWIIPGPTNVGVINFGDEAYIVDSGNDKEAGRRINRLLTEKGWKLAGIINTHSNADHVGGNDYLQRMHNCRIYATRAEKAFIETPTIEASFLWGGFPPPELRNKFFEAKPSVVTDEIEGGKSIREGIECVPLAGHYFGMVGAITADGVFFVGDCAFGEATLAKHPIPFIYDVAEFRKTLDTLAGTPAALYVPSHGNVVDNAVPLARANAERVDEIEMSVLRAVSGRATFEAVLKAVCDDFALTLDYPQYALAGSTVRSFLVFLRDTSRVTADFADNRMYWSAVGAGA
jgi:glyoxylase-like metal-dependent hydrolase (beta-lactamase superfamily II)